MSKDDVDLAVAEAVERFRGEISGVAVVDDPLDPRGCRPVVGNVSPSTSAALRKALEQLLPEVVERAADLVGREVVERHLGDEAATILARIRRIDGGVVVQPLRGIDGVGYDYECYSDLGVGMLDDEDVGWESGTGPTPDEAVESYWGYLTELRLVEWVGVEAEDGSIARRVRWDSEAEAWVDVEMDGDEE